jgi:type IV secretion system protein VirD4
LNSPGEEWLNFAFEMSEAGVPLAGRVEEEIAASRSDSSGGFRGILGELFKAFACLSDPVLMDSVSPPFDFSMGDLCAEDLCWGGQATQVYFMPPAEFVQAWSPVLKALFLAGQVYKSRAPSAPPQTWILDECAQLGAFPAIVKLFSIGAGQGIRPVAVFQSTKQIKALGEDAETIITASAQLRAYFAVRDLETATTLSRMIGEETLEFRDKHREAQARHARQKVAHALLNGEDPFQAGLDLAHHAHVGGLPATRGRPLRAPDQILGMEPNAQILFTDGVPHPVLAQREPYYEQAFMAGRYHPNPYHPPAARVRVKTTWGHRWREIVTEPVPARFSHYPQYQSGTWSRVQ